jgi:hypothetical protein
MITVKLKNVSIKYGKKFRHNQNYTTTFWNEDNVDENTTIEDVINLIIYKRSDKILLSKQSKIEIVKNTDSGIGLSKT